MYKLIEKVSLCLALVASFNSYASGNVIASSIPLPTLSISEGNQLSLSLSGVTCGVKPYFVDSAAVSILVNGTPIEFSRTCKENVLAFKPIGKSENELFAELITINRNLNLRYMASSRSYVYNDWQLQPVKNALLK
jgi:hypothetical protein